MYANLLLFFHFILILKVASPVLHLLFWFGIVNDIIILYVFEVIHVLLNPARGVIVSSKNIFSITYKVIQSLVLSMLSSIQRCSLLHHDLFVICLGCHPVVFYIAHNTCLMKCLNAIALPFVKFFFVLVFLI